MIEAPKYHASISTGPGAETKKRPTSVTCTNVERIWCPRGDLNPHPLYED